MCAFDHSSNAPQLQAQHSRLSDRIRLRRLKGAHYSQEQLTRIEDLCHTHVSHNWFCHSDTFAGSVLTPHDNITNVQKRLGTRAWTGFDQCQLCGSFLDPQLEHRETCSTSEATRGHHACVHAVLGGLKLADPGITTRPRGLTETQSRSADLFTTAAVPGRSAALDVCVASSNAAAARGDAAQAAFDRKLSFNMHEIPDLRNQGIHYRPFVWTADGRPHPAVTRTLQYAADIASSHNIQQMSAKSLQRSRKHEIEMALLRRRTAMTRPVLPNPSTRAECLLAGLIDRALSQWAPVPPLDGGDGDDDAESGTDTTTPDDSEGIASLVNPHHCNTENLQLCPLAQAACSP